MNYIFAVPALAAAAMLLSGCQSTSYFNGTPEGYRLTINQQTSNIIPLRVVQCVRDSLREVYPSTSIKEETTNLYSGIVPSDDANKPLATFEVDEWGNAGGGAQNDRTRLKVYQREPVDPSMTELFRKCL